MKLFPQTKIVIHGAFRSGTNYAVSLLELNYKISVMSGWSGAWKHSLPPIVHHRGRLKLYDVPVVLIVKDVTPWLLSVYNYLHSRSGQKNIDCSFGSFDEFLRSEFRIKDGGNIGSPQYFFRSPIDYWNSINYSVATLNGCIVVRYEDLLYAPLHVCNEIAKRVGRKERKKHDFIDVLGQANKLGSRFNKRGSLIDYDSGFEFDKRYYLDAIWRNSVSDINKAYIEESVSTQVVSIINELKLG